ncbi:MAG: xanthine dehydrogenase family protein molybdopterin-binding subunit [Betaproteobacteria bacterium]|nr:xanthine dehydrogenase family protein molybdopterin-binding subunit [Betaproteobacteria bacterium]MBK7592957.1 xanthine dehydrogenase family protein molybdopterin-binding subunit [Betaproteobacteria bacterium]
MTAPKLINASRRDFLAAGSGLVLGLYLPTAAGQAGGPGRAGSAAAAAPFAPNAFVRIGSDNTVTVVAKHLEMGQGVYTGLATIVADELDAAWAQVRIEGAPADAARYNNLFWGAAQGTGGSTAIANSWDQLRHAGAAARAMLVAAAARQWNVAAAAVSVRDGVVSGGGKKATFGELAVAAGREAVPTEVKLKDPKDFVFIGRHVPRKDAKAKSNGSALFTADVKLPDMLTAVVAHPPRFGARVKSFDAQSASLPGVRYVIEVPNGVAVVATSFWAAKKGRDALKIEWDEASAAKFSSADILAEFKRLAGRPGIVARSEGDAAKAMASAVKTLDAAFEFPYLAHAAMEPMDCVVKLSATGCEIWNGAQSQTGDQIAVAQVVGLKPADVRINMLYSGGSFGRRANPAADYLVEAASIAQGLASAGKRDVPIKLVWTREDDMRAGYYRPAYYHTLKAGLDADGNVVAWQHRIVGQSILSGTAFEGAMVRNGVDATSVEGASSLPYAIPNLAVDLHSPAVGVPVLWWRSVGSTHTAYSTETFIDELAQAAGKDPVAFRRALLAKHPRHLGVLELAAREAGWGKPLAAGKAGEKRGRGVAVHESFNSYVAEVVEVTVKADKTFSVDRVVCAVDCGIAVNPDNVRAQMEGGIGYGLSAALYGAITLDNGAVQQSNFHDYPVLRIDAMPKVEVHIVPSTAKPTGVGEPATPVIAPALANALAAATGQRLRNLPLKLA